MTQYAKRANGPMIRKIWCPSCAAKADIPAKNEVGPEQVVLWGYVAHTDMHCDRCNFWFCEWDRAVAITHVEHIDDYRPWEAYYLIPEEVQDDEHEVIPPREGPEVLIEKILSGGDLEMYRTALKLSGPATDDCEQDVLSGAETQAFVSEAPSGSGDAASERNISTGDSPATGQTPSAARPGPSELGEILRLAIVIGVPVSVLVAILWSAR